MDTRVTPSTIAIIVILLLLLGRLFWFPFAFFLVTGSSMYPVLKTGDLVVGEAVYLSGYSEGDIVVWYRSISFGVIHEVIEKKPGEIVTKGVNNPLPDPPVSASSVKYKIILSIPRSVWIPLAAAVLVLYAYKKRRNLVKALTDTGSEPLSIALWVFVFFALSNIATIMLSGIYYGGYRTSIPVPGVELSGLKHDPLGRHVVLHYSLNNTGIVGVNNCRVEAANKEFQCSYKEIRPNGVLVLGIPEDAYLLLWTNSNGSIYRFRLEVNVSLDRGVLVADYPVTGSWNRLKTMKEGGSLRIFNPNPVPIKAAVTIIYYSENVFGSLSPVNSTVEVLSLQPGENKTVSPEGYEAVLARVKIEYKLIPTHNPVVEVYTLELKS